MPEGHTLHRIANIHRDLFAGHTVTATSPQGRFAEGAAAIDGRRLVDVSAYGKHLFYTWDGAPHLHVHLGLVGVFRTYRSAPPAPTSGTRLVLATDGAETHLAGPMTCRLLDVSEVDGIVSQLGPDPLRGRRQRPRFVEDFGRKRTPSAAALLDQSVIAGIGNVYRSELLFLVGVHPATPAAALHAGTVSDLWDLAVDELRIGVREGRIVTVRPGEIGARRRSSLDDEERLYVYKRQGLPCRRCGTEIVSDDVGGRLAWWCPRCQPPDAR